MKAKAKLARKGEVMNKLYEGRYLSEGYPNLEKIGVEYYQQHQETITNISEIIACINRLINISVGLHTICVIGCGPAPSSVKALLEIGFDTVGIEPVKGSAEAASLFIGDSSRIINSTAEKLPLADNSQRIVLLENVLEHVDSPIAALSEAYRVLVPGGVLYIYTTNKYRISFSGKNGEFNVKFYNWFPNAIKESYVFKHLHYDPKLANYTPRPAVHWFSYSQLCKLGRFVGFAQFYSLIDLVGMDSDKISKSAVRKFFLNKVRYNPWLRALSLTQFGNSIFMLKRDSF
jgi:ubiquinone/menaquinone biosynthesis C-methylase UbiE